MQIFSKKYILIVISVIAILSIGTFISLSEKEVITPIVTEEIKIIEPLPQWTSKVIGLSVDGRKIEVYSYGNGATHVTFVGGIHGGYEWNSVLLAYTFIDYLKVNINDIPKNLTIDIIPSANPDGLFKVTNKEGRFTIDDVSTNKITLSDGRFNANGVDLNRNFDCKWKPKGMWRSKIVSAGAAPFSEPESKAIQNYIVQQNPIAVIFWHSQSNGVYSSQCEKGILPETLDIMNIYSQASGYKAFKTFDAYEVNGAVEDWLASINIPAITVELKTHETVEWEQNLAGIKAIVKHYGQ